MDLDHSEVWVLTHDRSEIKVDRRSRDILSAYLAMAKVPSVGNRFVVFGAIPKRSLVSQSIEQICVHCRNERRSNRGFRGVIVGTCTGGIPANAGEPRVD